ncbi:mas-related G-protein coupled receptor member D [Hippopotamus amphibius kiboko]|uniref:mas-related G-protein coupled receptor member D n=1 Tax=Hippopotamus amphibius kiboko TaxID=575201 RepID=UPI00259A2009|nr:mas-related G-protein coupled receptor member D [Hippopotamus amphibius kiboko]
MNQTLNDSWTPATNYSSPRAHVLDTTYWMLDTLVLFTCVGGISGNSLVVWLLGFHRQRGPYKVYVLHLAVADLLFLICVASILSIESTPLGHMGHVAVTVLRGAKYFASVASLSPLTAISLQRCLSVLFPIWYKCRQPQHLPAAVQRSFRQQRRQPTRLHVAILASALVFLFCALPHGIYCHFACLSSVVSSSANPVIYFLVGSRRSRDLQKSLGAVLHRALQEDPELEEGETPSHQHQ